MHRPRVTYSHDRRKAVIFFQPESGKGLIPRHAVKLTPLHIFTIILIMLTIVTFTKPVVSPALTFYDGQVFVYSAHVAENGDVVIREHVISSRFIRPLTHY